MAYQVIRIRGVAVGVRRLSDGAQIPLHRDNRDYREFQKWHNAQAEKLDFSATSGEPPHARDLRVRQARKYIREHWSTFPESLKEVIIALGADQ
jgi:hypothetical protein